MTHSQYIEQMAKDFEKSGSGGMPIPQAVAHIDRLRAIASILRESEPKESQEMYARELWTAGEP